MCRSLSISGCLRIIKLLAGSLELHNFRVRPFIHNSVSALMDTKYKSEFQGKCLVVSLELQISWLSKVDCIEVIVKCENMLLQKWL